MKITTECPFHYAGTPTTSTDLLIEVHREPHVPDLTLSIVEPVQHGDGVI